MGILDLGSNNEVVYRRETKFYVLNSGPEAAKKVEMHTVLVERGLLWEKALDLYKQNVNSENELGVDGFYISNQVKNNHRIPILAISSDSLAKSGASNAPGEEKPKSSVVYLSIYRPNTGLQVRQETPESLAKKYKRVSPTEAKAYWNEQYVKSATECTHVFRQGHCTNVRSCEIGLRTRKFYILAGSVLAVWSKVESVLSSLTGCSQFRLQIIRVKTNDDNKIVGCVIPTMCLKQINSLLQLMSAKTYSQSHVAKENSGESNCIVIDDEFT